MMKAFIEEAYGICVHDIRPLPRGFYGETYRADTDSGSFVVKLDRWPTHKQEFAASLELVDMITANGIDFVPALMHGRNAERSFAFDGGELAMFEYAEGIHTEDVPGEALFERLGIVYGCCRAPRMAADSLFTMAEYERVCRLKAALELSDAAGKAILASLDRRQEMLDARAEKLRMFMERCRGKEFPTVLTHGDAGGNCIVNSGGLSIIDWDTAKYSVPERDAWAHMTGPESIVRIETGLAKGGFSYRLDMDAFGFFANAWFFEYIGNYLQCAVDGSAEVRVRMSGYLEEYFGCWIFDVLDRADELL